MRYLGKNIICGLLIFATLHMMLDTAHAFGGGLKHKKEISKEYIGKSIEIIPLLNKINSGFSRSDIGEFYYVKTISEIFFQEKTVTGIIKKIDFDDEQIEVEMFNDENGFGKITFIFDKEQYEKITLGEFSKILFESLSNPNLNLVVANHKTKKYHLPNCNHLPPSEFSEYLNLQDANKNGLTPCGFCFEHFIYLRDYRLEKFIARKVSASMGYFAPVTNSSPDQTALSVTGKKVLSQWPIDLLGYDYRFVLIDSPEISASALPGGQIFLTSGLYNSLESPLELEAVLAHEIAHVEMRHSLKSFRTEQNRQQTRAAIAAFGGISAGLAVSRGNYNTASGAIAVSVVAMAMASKITERYSKEQESEADLFASLYFQTNGLDVKPLENVFRKLQFMSLGEIGNPNPKSSTHPSLNDRFNAIRACNIEFYNDKYLAYKYTKYISVSDEFKKVEIKPLFFADYNNKKILWLFITNDNFIEKVVLNNYDFSANIEVRLVIDDDKKHILKYKKKDTVFTEFGAMIKFTNSKSEDFSYSEIKNIKISVYGGKKSSGSISYASEVHSFGLDE